MNRLKLLSSLGNTRVFYIILVVMTLLLFTNIRFPFIAPYLAIPPEIKLNNTIIDRPAFYWMLALFSGLVSGVYILGKYAELKGILSLWKIVIPGITLLCLFMYYLGVNEYHIAYPTTMIAIRFINTFFQAATLLVSMIFLMKISHTRLHVKISSYFMLATLCSIELSYCTVTCYAPNNLKLWSGIFLAASILGGLICLFYNKEIAKKAMEVTPRIATKITTLGAKSLALLIGWVANSGLRYHYFFVETYVTDVLILKYVPAINTVLSSLFFYVFLNIFLIIAGKIIKHEQQLKFLTMSMIGILLVGIFPAVFPINSFFCYSIFQIIFAFFMAGFLAPSFSVIFSLFKHNQTIFNGTLWFTLGYALSNLASDWLTEQYGFFTHFNFLSMLPLVCGGSCCLAVLGTGAYKKN
jgi:MFS family permease